jgi:carnitine O-acetyltransferase
LTAANRDVWTKNRDELLKISPKNKSSLDVIESAAFVVCLDDTKPASREEISRACWHGDARNRFWDKACQFIIFDNGKAGFNGEVCYRILHTVSGFHWLTNCCFLLLSTQ